MNRDTSALEEQIAALDRILDWAMRAAVIDLATEPGEGDEPDADRFGPGTAEYLTELGVLDTRGFVTDLGVAAGWAFNDSDAEAHELVGFAPTGGKFELPSHFVLAGIAGVGSDSADAAEVERVLTPMERKIFAYMADGATTVQIAEAMAISARTVQTHVQHIYSKTGARRPKQVATAAASVEAD